LPVAWNADNERVLRAYQVYCGRYASETRYAHFAAIRDFERFTGLKSLRLVKQEDAAGFREDLARRGREGRSRSSITHSASQLSSFFRWLVQQEGFRQMNHSIPEYFELSRRDAARAVSVPPTEHVPIDAFGRMIGAMPTDTLIERRDRAVIAISCLAGTRASATASLRIGDIDVEGCRVLQDARWVRTKNSKSHVTLWFPVPDLFKQVLLDWIGETRQLGCGDRDALFPPDPVCETPRLLARTDREPVAPWTTDEGVRRAFRRGAEAAGVPYCNPHSVRHTLAALAKVQCRNLEEEQAWSHNLGHSDLGTTRRHYARMTDARRDALFPVIAQRDPLSEEEVHLLLAYHEQRLARGTPEFDRAVRLSTERMLRS
jgi:integrase